MRRPRASPADRAGAEPPPVLESLYDRHHPALLSFSRHVLLSRESGDSALEQTFVRAAQALGQGAAPAHVRAWLFTIARNRCLWALGSRRGPAEGAAELLPGIERLPADQRSALALADLGELPLAQFARVFGTDEPRAKALVHLARLRLIGDLPVFSVRCDEARADLAVAPAGAARRVAHARRCRGCRTYAAAVAEQRQALVATLPRSADPALRARVLEAAALVPAPPREERQRATLPLGARFTGNFGARAGSPSRRP